MSATSAKNISDSSSVTFAMDELSEMFLADVADILSTFNVEIMEVR